jgi:hypothetical protein
LFLTVAFLSSLVSNIVVFKRYSDREKMAGKVEARATIVLDDGAEQTISEEMES